MTRSDDHPATPDDAEIRQLRARAYAAERQVGVLARMVAIVTEIHTAPDGATVLDVIKEAVANLIGCEQVGIYRLALPGPVLELIDGIGVDPAEYGTVALEGPWLRQALGGPHAAIAPREGPAWELRGRRVTACVPLAGSDGVDGCLILFDLLAQKPALDDDDAALLTYLGSHAASALARARCPLTWPEPAQ